MSFCQSLNKIVRPRMSKSGKRHFKTQKSDQLTPIFNKHQWETGGGRTICKRCFKDRNPAMAKFGHKSIAKYEAK